MEAEGVDVVDDLAQVVAALDLVLNLANLVSDRVRPGRPLLKGMEIREELLVYEVVQVVADHRGIVVELAILPFRRCPALPAIRLIEDEGVALAVQLRFESAILLESVEILQEEGQEVCSM
jgi:hypothetical protein